MSIEEKLNELKEIEQEIKRHTVKTRREISDITPRVPDEITDHIAWMEEQLVDFLEPLETLRNALEGEIKSTVLAAGLSVKSDNYQAVYVKGRISWDSKSLGGYAAAHPEIEQFKKVSDPSVRIKRN